MLPLPYSTRKATVIICACCLCMLLLVIVDLYFVTDPKGLLRGESERRTPVTSTGGHDMGGGSETQGRSRPLLEGHASHIVGNIAYCRTQCHIPYCGIYSLVVGQKKPTVGRPLMVGHMPL